jgi:uncharacterized protein (DUF1501 family)/uncharacterized protein (DUF1800 family)
LWELASLVAVKIGSSSTVSIACARSYEGNVWELAPIQSQELTVTPVEILSCGASSCDISIPVNADLVYFVITQDLSAKYTSDSSGGRRLQTSEDAASAWYDRVAANLLLQATNGPTSTELRDLSEALKSSAGGQLLNTPPALTDWVHEQLTMQPTLHRAYWRARVNPRMEDVHTVGHPRMACDVGALWHRWAIMHKDNTKSFELKNVSDGTGGFVVALYIDGVLRTEINAPISSLNPSCSQSYCTTNLELHRTYYVCKASPESNFEYVGANIDLGDTCTVKPNRFQMEWTGRKRILNIPITFTKLSPPTLTSDNSTAIGFMDLAPNDIELSTIDEPSSWNPEIPVGALFLAEQSEDVCPAGTMPAVRREDTSPRRKYSCSVAARMASKVAGYVPISNSVMLGSWHYMPTGCTYDTSLRRPRFNTNPSPTSNAGNYRLVCVRSHTEFAWTNRTTASPSTYLASDVRMVEAFHVPCPLSFSQQSKGQTYMRHKGVYYMYDPRLELLENTPDSPAAVGMDTPLHIDGCPNVPKTFLNQDSCRVARGCNPLEFSDQIITLNHTTIQTFFSAGARYVFAIDNLRLETTNYLKSPCQDYKTRWRHTAGVCAGGVTALGAISLDILKESILTSNDVGNPYIRDVLIGTTLRSQCYADSGISAAGAKIEINGTCWQHVHIDTLNVYDFSVWKIEHPGTTPATNPFANMATAGGSIIPFPVAHSMSRWRSLRYGTLKNSYIGRLGDDVPFEELLSSVQTLGFAEAMGELVDDTSTHALVEVCGSPGEVANQPKLGNRYTMYLFKEYDREMYGRNSLMPDRKMSYYSDTTTVHMMINLYARDQLVQRLAFALFQIWVVAGLDGNFRFTERWLTYNDIMVRHATGNLRDLMREVSWNPVMGRWLTLMNSQSLAYSGTKPDENYAREIMQLFSIGLWELNEDGTRMLDASNSPFQTYTNDNIVAFARAWTGFQEPLPRGNLDRGATKDVDPMRLVANQRDYFPKTNLYHGHLGDHYPLCNSLPPRAYLRAGARFTYLGTKSKSKWTSLRDWTMQTGVYRYAPKQNSSALYDKLCNLDPSQGTFGRCQFQSDVTLDETLTCDPFSTECSINEPNVVAIGPPGHTQLDNTPGADPGFQPGLGQCQGDCDSDADCAPGLQCWHRDHGTDPIPPGCFEGSQSRTGGYDYCYDPNAAAALDPEPQPVVFYEYLRRPCVSFPFFEGGKNIEIWRSSTQPTRQCADPTTEAAAAGCCPGRSSHEATHVDVACAFNNEFVDYATALGRCEILQTGHTPPSPPPPPAPSPPPMANSSSTEPFLPPSPPPSPLLCSARSYMGTTEWDLGTPYPDKPGYYDTVTAGGCRIATERHFTWTQDDCSPQLQIGSDGMVNIVTEGPFYANNYLRLASFALDSGNLFSVRWESGAYPMAAANCSAAGTPWEGIGGCTIHHGDGCLCNTETVSAAVFTNPNALPSKAEIEEKLMIGAVPPAIFDAGVYTVCTSTACSGLQSGEGVTLYTRSTDGANPLLDEHAIFKIAVNGSQRILHLANKASTVKLLGGAFTFRNPPQFMNFRLPAKRDATYETEAMLDHLFFHRNTAPFTATRLIQNLVTSNPSPRYIKAVSTAFKTGTYGTLPFSGKYGDLAATASAIILDREARSLVLQNDPSFGAVRDPIQKMYHMMRAMELVPTQGTEAMLNYDISRTIGMMPYRAPSVFNFFMPQFTPAGSAAQAQLWAPAAQLGVAPNVINFQSAMTALIREGLNACHASFGSGYGCGDSQVKAGRLMFTPRNSSDSTATVDELGLLLTGGRLAESRRNLIKSKYEAALLQTGPVEALEVAKQLFAVAPEFNTNTEPQTQPKPAVKLPPQLSLNRPYKAIIVVYLAGGADTFNMIVPHSDCNGSTTSYAQYQATRTGAALPHASLLPIDVPNGTQPCGKFGLHEKFTNVKQLYEDGDASIFANIGNLIEPIAGRDEFKSKIKEIPRSLYSHEHQQTASRTLTPQRMSAKGILGRMVDALAQQEEGSSNIPYKTSAYSITKNTEMLRGDQRPPLTLDRTQGVVQYYYPKRTYGNEYALSPLAGIDSMLEVISDHSDNVFAETTNQILRDSLVDSEALGSVLDNATSLLTQDWTQVMDKNDLAERLYQVSRMIISRGHLEAERDIFYVDIGGWDMHNNIITGMLSQADKVDRAIGHFALEMKGQGMWDNVVVQTSSDFARTLVFNGAGTDHSWGGNHFTFGGNVKGAQMHGKFPSLDLDDQVVVDQRRGSLIPSTPWEGMWSPIAKWFGVKESHLNDVLPNLPNFPTSIIPELEDFFKAGS